MSNLFCGHHSIGLFSLPGTCCEHDATTWFPQEGVYYVHKGRTAIRRICELLELGPGSEVLAPAYNCGTEIDAMINSGVSVVLYQIKRSGYVDLDDLRSRFTKKTKAVYVTHYFGFPQPIADIKRFCVEKGVRLIEDCALALFSCDGPIKLGSMGDMSIFSFPKSLPVPDGGALVINNADFTKDKWVLSPPSFSAVTREMLSLSKRHILRLASGKKVLYPLLCSLFKKRQTCPNSVENLRQDIRPDMPRSFYYYEEFNSKAISGLTMRLLKTFNIANIVTRRRNNFNLFLNIFSATKEIEPLFKTLPESICPLYFPIIVKNRAYLFRELNELSIAAIEWWSGYHRDLPWEEYLDACFLKDNVLALPVHQQLNSEHITFIAEKVTMLARKGKA
jgi:dTDP-4-amino-4,6-dideoxygalactose transaminase